MTQSTVWTKRLRVSTLLIVGGTVGFLIAGIILRFPLLLSIIIAIFIGAAGVGGAILEMIVKAIAKSRAPITFRSREPYEFVKTSKGYINLAQITYVHCDNSGSLSIYQTDEEEFKLSDEDAVLFKALMDEFATPLRCVELGADLGEETSSVQKQS